MAYKLYDVPFGNAGDKAAIPTAAQSDGSVSMTTGYGPDYARQLGVDPLAKDITRESFNQALYDATSSIQALQAGQTLAFNAGFAAAIGGYSKGALVARTDGNGYWRSSVDANSTDPAAGNPSTWYPVGVTGSKTTALTNASVTLTDAATPLLIFTGALTANVNVILPASWVGYTWTVNNLCTGSFTLTIKTAAGAGVVVGNGTTGTVTSDGTNIVAAGGVQATETVAGIARVATQTEANNGVLDNIFVTPLKLANYIAQRIVQATETVFGIAKVATQALVNAGTDDLTFVTPKKLRNGFSVSLGANGWVALPSWLGGVIFQWGTTTANTSGGPIVTFPMAFPNNCWFATAMGATSSPSNAIEMVQTISTTNTGMVGATYVNLAPTVGQLTFQFFAVGN